MVVFQEVMHDKELCIHLMFTRIQLFIIFSMKLTKNGFYVLQIDFMAVEYLYLFT